MARHEKLSHEFGKQVSIAISQVFPIEQSGIFTVRQVYILSDFSEARIWISRIGGENDFFKRLDHAKNRIAKLVFQHIKMKKTPQILFFEDHTGENIQHMEEVIQNS